MFSDLLPEDLARPSSFAAPEKVYQLYRELRQDAPIVRVEPRGYRPFWLLTRHEDIAALESQAEIYQAGPRTVLLPEKVEAVYDKIYGNPNGVRPLTHMDGEYHWLHRAVTLEWFGAKNLKQFVPAIADIAKEFVDRMEDMGGECDFSADIAYWYPLRVVMTLMGVPREDEAKVLRLTQRLFSPKDKDIKAQHEKAGHSVVKTESSATQDVVGEFAEYFRSMTEDRRRDPKRDIVSTIANAQIKGCPMGDHETTCYYIIAATAGHDTTAASSGGGLSGLLDFPDQMAKLRSDLDLLETATDEFVRWTAPVKHFMRTPTQDVEWHGETVKAGEAIMLAYPSACRDDRVHEAPDEFRIDRPRSPGHLAFGYGPHLCLGKRLANLEMQAFFRELLPRLKSIELGGKRTYIESTFVSGLKSFPVRYTFG
ncbi:MAG: cytochrome P450 [Hyphomonadaceae bacterium]|nr:cytochrome P450 [Hyphomonadaceae bacterium]